MLMNIFYIILFELAITQKKTYKEVKYIVKSDSKNYDTQHQDELGRIKIYRREIGVELSSGR
jgi:hypothetical protein